MLPACKADLSPETFQSGAFGVVYSIPIIVFFGRLSITVQALCFIKFSLTAIFVCLVYYAVFISYFFIFPVRWSEQEVPNKCVCFHYPIKVVKILLSRPQSQSTGHPTR